MYQVLITDDHAIVRKGLKETLQEELGQVAFGEAASGTEALQQVRTRKWDLVLLDIGMEDRSGLEVLKEIRELCPKLPVLILSMYPESQFAVSALKSGAAGYINKQSAPDELTSAVRKVLAGGRYISPAVAEWLATALQKTEVEFPHQALSARELEIMRLLAAGKSLKEIATALSISVKMVGTYHGRLLEKMGMRSDAEITRYALLHKLVD